jgi:hypothetical protein
MRVRVLLCIAMLLVVVIGDTNTSEEEGVDDAMESLSDYEGSGRVFPLLPPYQGVDFPANFNKLKSSGDAAYFVVRDSIVFLGMNLMWIVIHSLIWDGEVSNIQDITASLLSPGQAVPLSNPSATFASSRLSLSSLSELSPVKMWNFFTNPNTSTRNLFLNIGFALGGHILWILPTFFGTLPHSNRREDTSGVRLGGEDDVDERLGGLPGNIASADPVTLWNRLLCPQCILQIVGINSINYFGKLLFWIFMSSVPDVPASTVIGRAFGNKEVIPLVIRVARGMVDNVNEMIYTEAWWREIS